MLPGRATKATSGIILSIVLWLVIPFTPVANYWHLPYVFWTVVAVCVLTYLWGCFNLSGGKGQSLLWALACLFPLTLIVLLILPDRFPRNPRGTPISRYHNFRVPGGGAGGGATSLAGKIGIVLVALLTIGAGWYSYETYYRGPHAVADSKQRAIILYPQLGVAKSALNQEFVTRYKRYQATNPNYFKDPDWPVKLAAESQAALGHH